MAPQGLFLLVSLKIIKLVYFLNRLLFYIVQYSKGTKAFSEKSAPTSSSSLLIPFLKVTRVVFFCFSVLFLVLSTSSDIVYACEQT